jgi:hypothetical protein
MGLIEFIRVDTQISSTNTCKTIKPSRYKLCIVENGIEDWYLILFYLTDGSRQWVYELKLHTTMPTKLNPPMSTKLHLTSDH